MIATALQEVDTSGISLRDAINKLQYDQSGLVIDRERPDQETFYKLGLSLMLSRNPNMRYLMLPQSTFGQRCQAIFK